MNENCEELTAVSRDIHNYRITELLTRQLHRNNHTGPEL
jgi:hypothetical protein